MWQYQYSLDGKIYYLATKIAHCIGTEFCQAMSRHMTNLTAAVTLTRYRIAEQSLGLLRILRSGLG